MLAYLFVHLFMFCSCDVVVCLVFFFFLCLRKKLNKNRLEKSLEYKYDKFKISSNNKLWTVALHINILYLQVLFIVAILCFIMCL